MGAVLPGRGGVRREAAAAQDVGGPRRAGRPRLTPRRAPGVRIPTDFRPALRLHLTGQCLDSSEFEGPANTT